MIPQGRVAAIAALGLALPSLVAYNVPPSATFFNQVVGVLAWGCFSLLITAEIDASRSALGRNWQVAACFLLLALYAAAASQVMAVPASLALSYVATALAAG